MFEDYVVIVKCKASKMTLCIVAGFKDYTEASGWAKENVKKLVESFGNKSDNVEVEVMSTTHISDLAL